MIPQISEPCPERQATVSLKTNHEHTLYVRYVFRKRLIFAERWSGKGFLPLANQRTDQGCSGGRTVDPVRRKKARGAADARGEVRCPVGAIRPEKLPAGRSDGFRFRFILRKSIADPWSLARWPDRHIANCGVRDILVQTGFARAREDNGPPDAAQFYGHGIWAIFPLRRPRQSERSTSLELRGVNDPPGAVLYDLVRLRCLVSDPHHFIGDL